MLRLISLHKGPTMHYSPNPTHCRVDFFKDTGKWYDTVVLTMGSTEEEYNAYLPTEFARQLALQYPNNYKGMTAVCLEPYSSHSHPVSCVHY